MKIIQLIGINNCTLIVYSTSADRYQFAIIDSEGIILEPGDVFCSCQGAEEEAREIINAVSY